MAPESALHDLRRSLGADAADSAERRRPLRERYRIERDTLIEWARSSGCILDGGEILNRVTGGGAEHAVYFDAELQAYVKITRRFGLTAGTDFRIGKRTQKYLAVPFARQATPLEYLERIVLFNEVFGDDIRFAGVIAGPEPAIVTTQPVIRGRDAFPAEIVSFMAELGFAPLEDVVVGRRDSASFFRAADGVAAFDAHGENVLAGETGIAPIDLFVIRAGEDLRTFLEMPAADRLAEVGRWVSVLSD